MKNVKVTDALVKKYFTGETGEGINNILNLKEVSYSNEKRLKSLLKKEVIAYLWENTQELNDQVDAALSETVQINYSGITINAAVSYEQLSVLKTYLGVMFQGKPVDGGEISYRKDKTIIVFNGAEFSIIAFDTRIFTEAFISECVKTIFGIDATVINDDQALSAVYKVDFESENQYSNATPSGYSNALINDVFSDSFTPDFLPMLYSLFTIKNKLQYKNTEVYLGDYQRTYKIFGDTVLSLKKEHVDWLLSNDYIDTVFRLKDKGRILASLCYLNFPQETLGMSTYLNFKSNYIIQATSYYANGWLGMNGKMIFKQSFIKEEIDEAFIANQEKKEFPISLPSAENIKRIYPHSERLNFRLEQPKSATDELVQRISIFDGIADLYNTNLTILSGFSSGGTDTFIAVPSLFYNTIVRIRPGAEFYHDDNRVYAFVGQELIAACVYEKESFNEFNLTTQKPYGGYGKMTSFDALRIVHLSSGILVNFAEATLSVDEQMFFDKLPIEQWYAKVYAMSAERDNQLNEKELVKLLFEHEESGFKQYKPEFLKQIEKAESVVAHAISKQPDSTLSIELLKLNSIKEQINLI